jgi:glycosyltransferase involved in cell wall biosynthesis
MKLALIHECYQAKGYGGISSWTKRLSSYYASVHLTHEIFSYTNGLKTRIPRFIRLIPNLREMLIYPYIGKQYLPKIEKEYDIIHFVAAPSIALYKPNIPTVVSVHYLQSRQNSLYKKALPLKYKVLFNPVVNTWIRELERLAYPNADRIIVCKEEFKQYLVENYNISPERIVIIKYGLNLSQFTPAWDWSKKERLVIFVGRGSMGKGFDTLVNAASQIEGNIVAVASSIPRFCQKKIEQLSNFKVVTGIPSEDLVDLYNKASVFVLPSLSEGSSLSTLEAMACGLPVVCTEEGGGGYIEDGINGYIFPVRDPIALADRVNTILDQPEIARRFGQINREKVEKNYTLPIIAEQTIKVYHELLN